MPQKLSASAQLRVNARLDRSLFLLRELSDARLKKDPVLIKMREEALRQHDFDAKDKVDPLQMTIFDASKKPNT